MAETFRKRKVEDFVRRLNLRESILRKQLLQREFATNEQFFQGQLSAVDAIIQELAEAFDLNSVESKELSEREWVQEATRSPSFEFLNDPSEDIYTLNDGRGTSPLHPDPLHGRGLSVDCHDKYVRVAQIRPLRKTETPVEMP